MKFRNLILMLLLLSGIGVCLADNQPTDSLVVISGTIKEKVHKKKLADVSLSVPGSNIATITNADGFFSIKVPRKRIKEGIRAEHIGYKTIIINPQNLIGKEDYVVWMEPPVMKLDEVTVYGAEPRSLIESAINKIPQNYSASQNLFSAFYRETIQKGKRYIGVSEAIVNVSKKPYRIRHIKGDRVQIVKGRRLMSQKSSDTIAVKIVGGPALPVVLDVVKNPDVLLNLSELDYYDFKMEPMALIDDRQQFVVSFRPKVKIDYALHIGKVYIDRETQSFTRAEFSLDVSDKEKATKAILYKKPRGLHFKPQEIEFVVTYKFQDGISYLNYIRTKTRFKCDWKRRLFSSGYAAYAEIVMVDREENPLSSISRKDAFDTREIFYDMVDNFSDADFWNDYNIIEPTESLEKAVLKLRK